MRRLVKNRETHRLLQRGFSLFLGLNADERPIKLRSRARWHLLPIGADSRRPVPAVANVEPRSPPPDLSRQSYRFNEPTDIANACLTSKEHKPPKDANKRTHTDATRAGCSRRRGDRSHCPVTNIAAVFREEGASSVRK